jgi:hypothetical protein
MHTAPPTYLSGVALATSGTGPASLLTDGTWCGHGEPLFGVYDIRTTDNQLFSVCLPSCPTFPELAAVTAVSPSKEKFLLYDPRKHPSSLYADQRREFPYTPAPPFTCPSCRGESFAVAVGFEVPGDSEETDDISWFALAVECSQCKWRSIIFDDETA